jgi:ribosomal protein S18 acetylase RimI-like enzyme
LDISIVKPETKHTEGIAEICSAGWRQTVEGKLSEKYQKKNVEFWYNHEKVSKDILHGMYSYIALEDQKVVGVVGAGITEPANGEIFVLYVDETYRYMGIGRLLLEKVTKDQQNQGVVKQWVSVQEGNQLGLPFYEARGFSFQHKRLTYTDTNEKQLSLRYARKI